MKNLNISVKSTNNIDNLSPNIYIKTKNRDSYGLIYPNNTSIFIDKNNNFDLEDRNFYGNLNIENNININNNIQVKKSIFINQPLNIRSNNNNNLLSIFNNNNKPLFYVNNNNIGFFTNQFIKHNTCVINSNINVDKNVSCDFNFNVLGNTYVSNNLNIHDTIFINNINTIANINITNNISVNVLGNGTFTKNLNVINNINVLNNLNNDYNIFSDINSNYYSNIKLRNGYLQLYKNIWKNVIQYPEYNNNNNIYLQDIDDINFKYKNKSILYINKNSITTNGLNIDNNKVLNISPNFYMTDSLINIDSDNFYVNNNNIFYDLINLEKHYYTPYNINFSKNINLSYNISYNMPRLYKNLKTYDTNISKNIEYISYQLCLGSVQSHFHPNWNNNSIIYYKKYIGDLNFINDTFVIPNNTNLYNTNQTFDFITTNNPTFNINIDSNDKLQYIYKTQNQTLDFLNNTNDKISMRIIPIYNIRDPTYIYYSEIVNI